MKVRLTVFNNVNTRQTKRGPAYEQSCQIHQSQDGYPDTPLRVTHWEATDILKPGVYEADVHFEPALYGDVAPKFGNFKPVAAAVPEARGAVAVAGVRA